MRIELPDLLAQKPIIHPTRVERVTICGDRMVVLVSGYPWWGEAQGDTGSSSITLVFEELSSGNLPVCLNDSGLEDLEEFSVQSLAEIGWAQPAIEEIYCNGPIPDPVALYAMFQAHLHSAGAFITVGDLLNQGTVLVDFLRLASGKSFLLARTPTALTALLRAELDGQSVPHTVVAHKSRFENRLWVRLNGQSFFCARAYADIECIAPPGTP
jgi:hypothetical protein